MKLGRGGSLVAILLLSSIIVVSCNKASNSNIVIDEDIKKEVIDRVINYKMEVYFIANKCAVE